MLEPDGPAGVLLYTDGLTEARHNGTFFGLEGVTAVLGELENPSASEAIATLRARVADVRRRRQPGRRPLHARRLHRVTPSYAHR